MLDMLMVCRVSRRGLNEATLSAIKRGSLVTLVTKYGCRMALSDGCLLPPVKLCRMERVILEQVPCGMYLQHVDELSRAHSNFNLFFGK